MALKQFAGIVAVVTGGASGIGLATTKALYQQGAHVVLADINEAALQQADQQVRAHNPASTAQVVVSPTDVTQEAQVQETMRKALDINGRIDLVVTSAGLGRGGPIDQFTAEEMRLLMDVNFMGTYNCVRAALPAMRQQQSGYFVFLSSVAGKMGAPFLSGYCATKWAVRGFSSALRAELYGTGIEITTVYPAWVDTPMIKQEAVGGDVMSVEALLTPEQVSEQILQAVQQGQRDLTLAPNQDIAFMLQVTKDNPDQAEDLAGAAMRQRLEELGLIPTSQQNA